MGEDVKFYYKNVSEGQGLKRHLKFNFFKDVVRMQKNRDFVVYYLRGVGGW